ncbi:UDP-N-acetylmuramate dehydrogenase [Alkalitalea saponilacus]|uniref:UDP-N-acetylenolpyruvoylglucosamine reductase n=1 Tax=Alkalitalea saponilacus TaxID=889453 RepID=A0A1T5FJM7_9BACT|nr:UDP-N-acetylmuramate dehydrogenase [Alkalitalea saponilacus]SKB96308.1 UDP-N-acetylmuramate dehydrogenase [Alkalitalea saponilacus]
MLKLDYCLKDLNTFGLDIRTKYYFSFSNEQELEQFVNERSDLYSNGFFILGGGSNVLFTKDFAGLIFHPKIKFIEIINESDHYVDFEVGAGLVWDDFVEYCVNKGLYGIENLSYIPGFVGAVPVQNIGAYGVEAKDFILSVRGYDIFKNEFIDIPCSDCRFSYRNSVFKTNEFRSFIILSVKFRLCKLPKRRVEYFRENPNATTLSYWSTSSLDFVPSIFKSITKLNLDKARKLTADYGIISLETIRKNIIRTRKRRLPDYRVLGNVGSFYKSPIVNKNKLDQIKKSNRDVIYFPMQNDEFKISVGWLIEYCGFKGVRVNNVGVDVKRPNMILNYGNGVGMDIDELAQKIEDSIFRKFGIRIEREVVVI